MARAWVAAFPDAKSVVTAGEVELWIGSNFDSLRADLRHRPRSKLVDRLLSIRRYSISSLTICQKVKMRRQGKFGDSPASAYGVGQIQNAHSYFQGQLEAFTPERDQPYSDSQTEGQWRWERGQGVDSSRTYYRGQMDPKSGMEKQGNNPRAQPQHKENPKPGCENNRGMQTLEGVEQKFMDDITRLAKDQIKAEDVEIARHREKINTINTRYGEQLAALRARHTGKREEIMRKESQARQQQYKQQTMGVMDQYHPNAVGPASQMPSGHPQGPTAVADAPSRSYGSDRFEGYGERSRFQDGTKDHGFESRGQYPGGTVYDTSAYDLVKVNEVFKLFLREFRIFHLILFYKHKLKPMSSI